ncbi:MAG: phytoene desaturase family protein [Candidatus Hermodarchaeota archaeon]
MSPQNFERFYDVVVIGAGNGGLTATAQLAIEGKKVILFEQHNLPGGFATSFMRGRFEFEATLHELCDYGPPSNKGSIRKLFEDDLGINVEFIEIPEAFRLIVTNPDEKLDIVVPFGEENFINILESEVPGSKDSVRNYLSLCNEIIDAIAYITASEGNPDKKKLIKEYKNFLKVTPYTLDQVNNALKIPKKAQDIINAYWCYIAIPTSRINFSFYAAMHYYFIIRKAYFPKYRSHGFTAALESKIRKMGGNIQFNTKVEKILVKNGKVIGVETSKGDKIKTNHVISNASPTLIYNNLIYPKSEIPKIAYKNINARRHAISCFVVYLGLNASAEELGISNYSYHIYETTNTEEIYESFKTLNYPKAQATVCLSNIIPDCSPSGTCMLSITAFFLPEAWKDVKARDYFKLKNRIADDLIDAFEKATGSSIRDHIEEIEIATPQTLARYTGTYYGSAYGYETDPWDSFMPRLMAMTDEKYIEGLEVCGGFSANCQSYTNALLSGQITAFLTIQDLNKKEGTLQ